MFAIASLHIRLRIYFSKFGNDIIVLFPPPPHPTSLSKARNLNIKYAEKSESV
jgi:hypothetical protein